MSVIKRGESKYWYIQFQLNNQTFIKSSKTTDKKLAEMMELSWRHKLITQQVQGVRERVLLVDAINNFVDSKRDLASHKNLTNYRRVVTAFFRSVKYLDELASRDLERLKLDRLSNGYGNQTIKHMVGMIRGTLDYAKRMGYQISDLEYPKLPVGKGRLRYLSFDEELRLLDAIDPYRDIKGLPEYAYRPELLRRDMQDLHDFVVLLLDTGARYSEIAGLEWQKVNLQDRSIALWRPKVQNESVIYMTDRVFAILTKRLQCKKTDYVFQNRNGEARNYISVTIRKAFKRAGITGCTAHTLRHTHATRLIQNGLNIYEVKEILGHADIRTTMRYAHIEQRNVSAKAVDVIDRLNKENAKAESLPVG